MIRIVLVDDHALVRAGFSMIIGAEPDMKVVGEADTGEAGLQLVRKLEPDVLLCDLHLPGVSGLEVTERLAKSGSRTRVIIVSVQEDGPMPKRLLSVGASGYLGKGGDAGELIRAIRDVASGRRYVGGEVAQRLALGQIDGRQSPFDQLTPRELEVALMLCQGRRTEDMAKRLSLSPKTISTHKYRVYDKLGLRDPVALARLAAQYGLVQVSA
ncbi:MAG: response regulator transcription factor [Xanthomonadaceae bacterium]|jgi:DNA-binding NarL/FixJ family response regulator|nr:response regulator transcription factor [Xanthomonadaceae bacterium]